MPCLVSPSYVRAFCKPFALRLNPTSRWFTVPAPRTMQNKLPLLPGSVENVLHHAAAGTASSKATIWDEFSLKDRVGIVSGGNRGLGLEMSLALCELGARIYVLDLPKSPSEDFKLVAKHIATLGDNRSLEYVSTDVTVQQELWTKVEKSEPCFLDSSHFTTEPMRLMKSAIRKGAWIFAWQLQVCSATRRTDVDGSIVSLSA